MRLTLLAAGLALLACAAPRTEAPAPGEPPVDTAQNVSSTGYLSWEDLSVRMVGQGPTAGLRIDVTTLNPDAVRLASDDIRTYLSDQRARIAERVRGDEADRLTAFLVGYTGFEKEIGFDPTRLQIRSEGSTYYAQNILPVSAKFDRRIVGLYETVYGIYLFPAGLDLIGTLEFQYDDLSSGGSWRRVVEQVQRAKTQRQGDGG
ncbi:MAG TPA: hypothetical protein VEY33_07640 [Gemmatimonadota bacterium]|nr:hypothetical protein [Gemmatimonadota bacterium]